MTVVCPRAAEPVEICCSSAHVSIPALCMFPCSSSVSAVKLALSVNMEIENALSASRRMRLKADKESDMVSSIFFYFSFIAGGRRKNQADFYLGI